MPGIVSQTVHYIKHLPSCKPNAFKENTNPHLRVIFFADFQM